MPSLSPLSSLALHMITLFYQFILPSLHNCDVKLPNAKVINLYCIFLSWDAVLPLQLQLNFPSERVGIMGKEFERKRSHGFNDVFTASPLSNRKVPILDVRLIEVCFKQS